MISTCNVCDRITEVLDTSGVCGFCNDEDYEARGIIVPKLGV